MSDHLKIFMDKASTLEQILQAQGEEIKKGKLGIRQGNVVGFEGEEDIEFWDDGTKTEYKKDGESMASGRESRGEEEDTVL